MNAEMIVTDSDRRMAAIRALHRQNISTGERLIDLADSALEGANEIDPSEPYAEDRLHEIADSAVSVMTAEILATASESLELLTREPELGPAFDGSPTPANIAAANLYELARDIASERLRERQEGAEDE